MHLQLNINKTNFIIHLIFFKVLPLLWDIKQNVDHATEFLYIKAFPCIPE